MGAMRALGIDPGISGGVAIVMTGNPAQLIDVINIPVIGVGAKSGSMRSHCTIGS
jgi:hypothetical protein